VSYESGMAAFELQFTERVPRTEYSADNHWNLIQAVTGIDTSVEANRPRARHEFVKAWDYAFLWSTTDAYTIPIQTDMGHAVYAQGGRDFRRASRCPFKTVEEALQLDVLEQFGTEASQTIVDRIEKRYGAMRDEWSECVTTAGVYHTMFSGLIAIFGWEMLLLAGGSDPDRFSRVVDSYYRWIEQYYQAHAKSSARVFIAHDDICWSSGPVFHPDWYRKHIFPKYKELFRPLREAGKIILFTSDGDYTMFFDDIVACGADGLVMEPCCDMARFAEKYGKTHGFVGNADTRVLLTGSKQDIYSEVKRCMDIGKEYPGFIMAVGNHIPPNTPVDNALYYNEAYMELGKR